MIKLVVGLGNPGRQYEKTRHNAGFLFLDRLAAGCGGVWLKEARFQALFTEGFFGAHKCMLLKPETFMNRSGYSVGKVARYYKLLPEEILVVHDELDFDVGVVRLKKDGGHAGHNGLRDIIAQLGSRDFYRLRIGVGRPVPGRVVADFVLSEPSKGDWNMIDTTFDVAISFMPEIVAGNLSAVMNKMNT
ncbi:aminoacyl-tRNA hydrolase [Crenothrix polyspora]|uniref:Peptidyl-tRNA hydrolase n=1 Tax=Crenothrix polyspora TaxID=360316 RepID=A0A1R4HJM9_9GAMM|nr:aminoacyl-tRNA hydrolase [Crenothrix polyspora]SJM96438.1 peptidyl-tRNA hydrolase [Crenothrix polyspora]